MKLAVVGSRGIFLRPYEILSILKELKIPMPTEIISGGASGVDTSARNFAKYYGIKLTEYIPEWSRYGKSAGFRRNKLIVDDAQQVLAIWDGVSKGTQHSINLAREAGKPVYIHKPLNAIRGIQSTYK